jgi:hypothetical protein
MGIWAYDTYLQHALDVRHVCEVLQGALGQAALHRV